MIFTLSRLISARKFSLQSVRYYRLPPNLTSFLDDYSQEYKNNQNTAVIESYKSIKSKIAEYEELRSFIDTSTDKELVEIAEIDLESISENIDNEVNVIKQELFIMRQKSQVFVERFDKIENKIDILTPAPLGFKIV